jgi:hypothetical protein
LPESAVINAPSDQATESEPSTVLLLPRGTAKDLTLDLAPKSQGDHGGRGDVAAFMDAFDLADDPNSPAGAWAKIFRCGRGGVVCPSPAFPL